MNRTGVLRSGSGIGKYRIERKLGEGAFAVVYRALDTLEGLRVALKVPHANLWDAETEEDFHAIADDAIEEATLFFKSLMVRLEFMRLEEPLRMFFHPTMYGVVRRLVDHKSTGKIRTGTRGARPGCAWGARMAMGIAST